MFGNQCEVRNFAVPGAAAGANEPTHRKPNSHNINLNWESKANQKITEINR